MASAFSQSTFLSADNAEPSPPPAQPQRQWDRKKGLGREGRPWPTLPAPRVSLPGPWTGTSIPELDPEASVAQGCSLPCRLLLGSWTWQKLLALPGSIY